MLHDIVFVSESALWMRLEELWFFYMRSMNFIQFPTVAICLKATNILNLWIDWVHMLQTPQPCTHRLSNWENFKIKSYTWWLFYLRKKNRQQREPNRLIIKPLMLSNVRDPQMVAPISLIQKAINCAMKLTHRTWLCIELKRNIECCVSCCFNKNQLSHRKHIFIFPYI